MKTFSEKDSNVNRQWFVVDLEGETVGRAATKIATILRGKHKPTYTPHVDCGDFVICVNADKIAFTGKKLTDKIYHRHSGYPGGLKSISADELLKRKPQSVITYAIQGMLPKTKLGREMIKKLKVYAGAEHPHQAQQPQALEL